MLSRGYGWIVSLLLGVQEAPEFRGELIVAGVQAAEVRIAGYPFRRALHLALGVVDSELQAGDHLPGEVPQLVFDLLGVGLCLVVFGFANAVFELVDTVRVNGGVNTGQVVRGRPGRGAALPGPAAGAKPLDHRRRILLSRRPAWLVRNVQDFRDTGAVTRDGGRNPQDRLGVRQLVGFRRAGVLLVVLVVQLLAHDYEQLREANAVVKTLPMPQLPVRLEYPA